MTRAPQDTSAEEPDGGNLQVRLRRGPGRGNRPGLLNNRTTHIPSRRRFLAASAAGGAWLMHGCHNQPAGPHLEPSHIHHFRGRVARCSGFSGMGTDGKNERLLFGTKTTDYGIMDGEYWAARAPQTGAFTHI